MENKWIEIDLPFGPIFGGPENDEQDSFTKRYLNNAGTLIQLEDGREFLIGNINECRGVCDDCCEFYSDAIVARYCPLKWEAPTKEVKASFGRPSPGDRA